MAKLVFHSGAYQGKRVTLPPGKSITLGRNRDIDLPLPDPKLSRKHCQILSRNDQFVVRDLNSTNGTFVNGSRLNGEYQLKPFDRIVLGDVELEFLDENSARLTADAARTAVARPAVADAPAAAPGNMVIESSDLLDDIIEAPAPAQDPAQGSGELVEELDINELLEQVPSAAAAAHATGPEVDAGAAFEEEVEEEEDDFAAENQIPVPVPQRAISSPPGKSGRVPPGSLAPSENDAVATTPAASANNGHETGAEASADPLQAALDELSLPLPPEPPPLARTARPKVLFCDNCDASIPLLDWDLSLARAFNGKNYCQQCLPEFKGVEAAVPAAPAPVGHGHGGKLQPAAAVARQEKRISDILAGLDEEAVIVDTTIKRRGHVIQEEEISQSLKTLEDAQQKTNGSSGLPSHAISGRASRSSGYLAPGPAGTVARSAAPAPSAATPAKTPNEDADPLLEDLEEIE